MHHACQMCPVLNRHSTRHALENMAPGSHMTMKDSVFQVLQSVPKYKFCSWKSNLVDANCR